MKPQENVQKDIAKTPDSEPRTQLSGALAAIFVFLVAYAIFALSYGHWGVALGWLPSTAVAAAFGWLCYRFPWIGEAVVFLLELAAMFLG